MTFFETLVALLAVAILLLQVTRRMRLPYPGILAAAGVAVAMLPGAPTIPIDPPTALALFIAPVLVDSAYDFPVGAARRMLLPLFFYAVVAVLVTTGVVVSISMLTVGLPIAVAVTLGAIVSPPDAAAATAVLSNLPVARRVDALLKGESLFNDATALLLFGAALTVQARGGLDAGTALQVGLAAPGGIVFGIVFGFFVSRLRPITENTVGGTLLQFVYAFSTWLIAEHLHLSAVLATVASAMTLATLSSVKDSPRMRVHSFAVWTTVVFLLNVVAFLLMGLQARRILETMSAEELQRAMGFAAIVVVGVILARMAMAFLLHAVVASRHRRGNELAPFTSGETLLVGWAGMRGLVTLATAFALPADFPERDLVVLTAFTVVLATLVIQGATLAPMIHFLKLGRQAEVRDVLKAARRSLAEAAFQRLEKEDGTEAEAIRTICKEHWAASSDAIKTSPLDRRRDLTIAAVLAERQRLEELRDTDQIGATQYLELQEDLDWKQLSVGSDEDRRITES
ncbi:cation:proton antiporter [Rhizobium laguerreae]|uniref:cation:proton antiporter n=1 Tax=Rhizobium laguerreae TaxID=1076926 RepID=UPI001C9121C4|nr:sodium:proton antiporter [Rhizobium laguerreae]MBY3196793.1 sodium:proton antiporter [Rhizobium laguerreae]MBY3343193.1 sodium:proton antiporter [Rhizobium laguerreae]MBY3350226.1 sodium:proton antiporter [Rhizobium laguerreae]MBY3371330.1 sodium:proton antiporter [Rhizobium laguerreae]MBY3426570.1 sodium:proton antiporter [Rhizobium laguerreae]